MISPYSLSVPGGVQNQIIGLARAIRDRGRAVRVLGPCDGPPPEPFVTPLGNSVPTGANGSVAPLAPDPAAQLRTIRALRDEEFDVLHIHEPMAPGPTMTALLIKPAPIVATFHAAGSSLAYDIFKPLTSRGANRIDRRFAVSADAEALAFGALGGTYDRAFNGVEVERFRGRPKHRNASPTVLFLGRHEERKGLAVLLEAFSHLDGPATLWVGGVGPETAALRDRYRADTRINWLGELDEDDKVHRMRQADVFCAPSLRGESFGIVLLEAMAAETPVLAARLSGYERVIKLADGAEAGVLVEPGDARALSAELAALLSDPARQQQVVQDGRRRAEEFSMSRLADLYIDAYETAIASQSRDSSAVATSREGRGSIMKSLRRPR